jgi:hypothetical protein
MSLAQVVRRAISQLPPRSRRSTVWSRRVVRVPPAMVVGPTSIEQLNRLKAARQQPMRREAELPALQDWQASASISRTLVRRESTREWT